MNILVIGGGGREHALVWKISQSPLADSIVCAPGNAGISQLAECVSVSATDIPGLLSLAREKKIDLTVVGPEDPLSIGVVDAFQMEGFRVFGPSRRAAAIEASKSFAKRIMEKYHIPTAGGETFTDYDDAARYIEKTGAPVVVKADGLAAGKGVFVCQTKAEALTALDRIIKQRDFGDAGDLVVVEEFLAGEEASFLAFSDGKTVLPLPTSQDHKAVFDGDKGLNTGGMGAYSPAPVIDRILYDKIMNTIMEPMVKGLAAEGYPYKGVLYAGLMIHQGEVKVLEFNCRFGDPEAQPLLSRLSSDLVPVMEAVIDGRLDECRMDIDPSATVCVVMASGGYPEPYDKGHVISGITEADAMDDVTVFHAATDTDDSGGFKTSGGRVLGVTAKGDTVESGAHLAYEAVNKITWKDAHFRKDIGQKAIDRFKVAPKVGIVMGSDSDLPIMDEAARILKQFDVPFEMTVASAHRSPDKAGRFAATAKERGMRVIIAGAGHAAHLAGVLAAHTPLPVIGVPIDSSCLKGMDALLATVQMPPGIPVATMAIGKPGARNAALFAVQILSGDNEALAGVFSRFKTDMAKGVEKKAAAINVVR